MHEVPFAFLTCLGCQFFVPKRMGPVGSGVVPPNPAQMGFCTEAGDARQVVWQGLDRAVAMAGWCTDREPWWIDAPGCPHFEVTMESASQAYPYSCIHYLAAICPMGVRR
jgi:hypothetical protein